MEFIIQKANKSQYDIIVDLIRNTCNTIEPKEWFAADADEYTHRMLTEGKATGYMAIESESQNLAAIFMTLAPGKSPENLGYDIGLSDDKIPYVAHMESVVVHPDYRGHKLQRRLMEAAEKDLKAAGYRYLLATIHPENPYSMNNALSLGYQVMRVCEKYGGYLRAILMKEI